MGQCQDFNFENRFDTMSIINIKLLLKYCHDNQQVATSVGTHTSKCQSS